MGGCGLPRMLRATLALGLQDILWQWGERHLYQKRIQHRTLSYVIIYIHSIRF
jgi:hypothetical protein